MATVYLADDLKHGRKVAIKVMLPELAAAIGRDRFLREIEIAARLTHPHILPLYDSGVADGQLYYVTPFIAGETLGERITREKQLPIGDAIRLAREIASALGYAHHQGLVHRDIKPGNILLADNIALVADFGIARAIPTGAVSETDETAAGGLTSPGMIVGTPRYMAPEQAAGRGVDARADLYALGCVLYEMLAGHPPFSSATAAGLIREHLTVEARPINELRPSVPAAVAAAIAKALAKLPADRPATAARFAESLVIATTPTPPEAPRSDAIPTNIPKQRTHFIGRERELAECARLLDDTRLLTLTGIGGCGKTRLAIKLAEGLLATFPDGVWFVDLAPLKDPEHVILATATALGVRETAGTPLLDTIASHVATRRTLILLDNCEHVLTASADLADRLLTKGRELKVIVTSREGLGVEGERPFALKSLSIPPAAATGLHAIETAEAVRLFVDRARVVDPGFELTEKTAPVVAEICRRLDGIPLAIELAAARVKILSPDQIRSKLGDRFRLLTGGSKTALPRHQTLRATLQWSYDQLSDEEQRLFRQLSVFAGGSTLDLATRVAGTNSEFEVMDILAHLVDKSLVVVEKAPDADSRYGLLETVRQFAQERLTESGQADDTRQRHFEAFLAFAEEGYKERINQEEKWARALESDHDNLRAALEVARHIGPEPHLQMAGALAWFWQVRSHFIEAREHLTEALAASPTAVPHPARARALWGMANTTTWQGDGAKALPLMEEAHQMWRDLGDAQEAAIALEGTGWAQLHGGNHEGACATFRELLKIQREGGDLVLINRAMVAIGQVLVVLEQLAEAREISNEIVAFSRSRGDRRNEHFGLHYLADCALVEGKCEESLERYKESLKLAWAIGDRLETSFEVQGVGMSLAGLGDTRGALRLAAAAQAEWDRIGVDLHILFWDRLMERYMGKAREALGVEEAALVWGEGRGLGFEEAVREALHGQSGRG